jgi:hypothetical protein
MKWEDVTPDIKEALYTFDVLTRAGIPSEVIQLGWSPVLGEGINPVMIVRVGPRKGGFVITDTAIPTSWCGDPQMSQARLMTAMEMWNALPNELKSDLSDESGARKNAALLLGAINMKTGIHPTSLGEDHEAEPRA